MKNTRIDQVILARIVRKFLHDITNVNGTSYMIFQSGKVLQPTRDNPDRLRLDVVRENTEILNSMISRFATHISDQIPSTAELITPGDLPAFITHTLSTRTWRWPDITVTHADNLPNIRLNWDTLRYLLTDLLTLLDEHPPTTAVPLEIHTTWDPDRHRIEIRLIDTCLTMATEAFQEAMDPFRGKSKPLARIITASLNGAAGLSYAYDALSEGGTQLTIYIQEG